MNIYERDEWTGLPEGVMRPGGMDITEELVRLSGLDKKARILDVGCGLGCTVAYLKKLGYEAEGADISAPLIARGCKLYPDIPLYAADAAKLPFDGERFDAVIYECSLLEMRAGPTLLECRRLLKRGGMILVSDLYDICGSEHSGEELMTLKGWNCLLIKHGFEVVHMEDRSGALSDFIAQIFWRHGSLDILSGCGKWHRTASAQPGYFMAVAHMI